MSESAGPSFQLDTDVPGTLGVHGVLSFDTAAAALNSIRAAMADRNVVRLDLSGISRADSAGLACVVAAVAEAGSSIDVVGMPDGMRALAQVCELDNLIG